MKKYNLTYLSILILLLILTSCSNDDKDNPKEYLYSYDIKTYVNKNSTSNKSSNGENDTDIIKTKILSTDPLDSNMTEEEFAQLLIDIEPNIKIETLLNDEKLLEIDIVNGVTERFGGYPNSGLCPECDHDANGNISDSMDCSQQA